MANNIMLYWGSGSPACWRVQVVLEEKRLQGYQNKLLSFDKEEPKSPEVLAINPRGQVPAFKHGDIILNESIGICLYLEDLFKSEGVQLMPDDPREKALILQRSLESNNIFQKIGDITCYNKMVPENERSEAGLQRLKDALSLELKLWEGYAAKMGTESYVAGKNFTMADAVIFPLVALVFRFGASQAKYPYLAAYYNLVKNRPSIQATWPPHWKTNPNTGDLLKNV
ncbi:glutathione S-transferase A-like [Protopterus annectens]|uniref:glutathione S-transferase A-like n=1 Tax=Protopterus annectens TaxID=7888 RepID=UPI001CFAEA4D|nr:glutathione S-transferase A-like [Protopterus annectens]